MCGEEGHFDDNMIGSYENFYKLIFKLLHSLYSYIFFVFLVVNGLLITLQNCTEILRNLTFVAQLAYICIRLNKGREQQKKVFISLEQLLLQKANF